MIHSHDYESAVIHSHDYESAVIHGRGYESAVIHGPDYESAMFHGHGDDKQLIQRWYPGLGSSKRTPKIWWPA